MIENFSTYEPPVSTTPRWMMSFADLLSLILTFFVLMYSMSVPPKTKDDENNNETSKQPYTYSVQTKENTPSITVARTDLGLSTDYLYNIIKDQSATYPSLEKLKLKANEDRLLISIPPKDFNDELADGVAHILKNMNNKIAIYSSNLDDAHFVIKKLQEKGMDKNITFFESRSMRGKIDIIIYP